MTPRGKKVLIISISLLAIGGVVGYIFWKKAKDKKDAQTKVDADKLETAKTDSLSSVDKAMADLKTKLSETPKTDDKPTDVKAFQDWMDKTHPNWVNGKNLNRGGGYGNFGSATQGAWATYKTEFGTKTVPKSIGGFTAGQLVYSNLIFDTAYSYPSKETRYQVGTINRDGAKPIGTFIRDSNVKNWIQVRALPLRKYDMSKAVQDVFLYNINNTYTPVGV